MTLRFIKEEEGQAAIEYVLLAGGIIIAALVIFKAYSRMTKSAGNKIEKATGTASSTMQDQIEATST